LKSDDSLSVAALPDQIFEAFEREAPVGAALLLIVSTGFEAHRDQSSSSATSETPSKPTFRGVQAVALQIAWYFCEVPLG